MYPVLLLDAVVVGYAIGYSKLQCLRRMQSILCAVITQGTFHWLAQTIQAIMELPIDLVFQALRRDEEAVSTLYE